MSVPEDDEVTRITDLIAKQFSCAGGHNPQREYLMGKCMGAVPCTFGPMTDVSTIVRFVLRESAVWRREHPLPTRI